MKPKLSTWKHFNDNSNDDNDVQYILGEEGQEEGNENISEITHNYWETRAYRSRNQKARMNFIRPLLHFLGASFFVQVSYQIKQLK